MVRKIWTVKLDWDSIGTANKITDAFIELGMTYRNRQPLKKGGMIFGASDDGRTAFIIEGFDHKNNFGLIVTIPHDKKEISFIGGPFNKERTMDTKYHDTFTDIGEASKFFEKILREYEIFCNTPIAH